MSKIVIGKVIKIDHSRKGKFSIRVNKIDGTVITGTITTGVARYMSEPHRVPGDTITIDTSRPFAKILSVSEPALS